MATHSSSGTCLSVSAALPATYNAAGFNALTFTQVGELESVGEMVIRRNTGEFSNLCTGNTSIIKGNRQAITVSVVCALDEDDAGQVLMMASEASNNLYSFRVTRSNGAKDYFVGTVVSAGMQFGGDTDVVKAPYDIGIQSVPEMTKPILTVSV